jgi:8-oxoguanine deaminase
MHGSKTLLIHHAERLVTMDAERREIADGAVFARGGVIEAVGPSDALPATADEVIDARDHVVLPGLVNTHHHMYQTLTRAQGPVQDATLFPWLQGLYPVWARLTPEMLRVSTQIAAAELLLSGCTTSRRWWKTRTPSSPTPSASSCSTTTRRPLPCAASSSRPAAPSA